MASLAQSTRVSPTEALREAFEWTRRQMFPVRVEKWLVLGLLAFLDQCGRSFRGGGGGNPGGGHSSWVRGGPPTDWSSVQAWLQRGGNWLAEHAAAVALASLAGLLVIAVLAAVVLWVNARGVFMYLDNVASGRADIGRPWRQHAAAANSYFGWSLGISLAGLFVVLLGFLLGAAALLSFASGRLAGSSAWLAAAALAPVLALLLLALPLLALAALALRDFVAPLQLATGLACGPAARLLEQLVMANPGAFVLYLLLKLVLVIATGVVIAVLGCLTCCVGFLPVVMQVVFQPLFYLERSFSVCLLKQLGHDTAARLAS